MERSDVERWIEGYVRAWETNDPQDISALFTEDARYYTAPSREPWAGRDAIVTGWLGRKDEPRQWTFRWEVLGTDGDLAFVRGHTEYPAEDKAYENLWVIRLGGDARCSEFTEWWMETER